MRPLYPAARRKASALRRPLNRRRPLLHGSRSLTARQEGPHTVNVPVLPQPEAFDPDMLYVECGHCGAPIVWEKGRTRRLLAAVGIDPLELDASCVLITDSCPLCGGKGRYTIRSTASARPAAAATCSTRAMPDPCHSPKTGRPSPREAGVLSSGFPACGTSCRPPGDNDPCCRDSFLLPQATTPPIPGLTAVLSKGWGILGPSRQQRPNGGPKGRARQRRRSFTGIDSRDEGALPQKIRTAPNTPRAGLSGRPTG